MDLENFPSRKYKWLFLPLETKVRELDGKLLLAAIAAERGWAVIIGYKSLIAQNIGDISGVIIEKDAYDGRFWIEHYLTSKKPVCLIDEEGLVYRNSWDYYRRRLNTDNLHKMEYIFLWGGIQHRDILEHIPGIEQKLVLTGNPRFDMLRPELRDYYKSEAIQLKNKYGNFILINTNFADSNHFFRGTDEMIDYRRKSGFIKNDNEETEERAFIEYQARIVDFFAEMVPRISNSFSNHKIIIRPHPSENHHKWVSIARGLKNVSVIHEGDVNPWILAADVFIHNGCMTGIQGFLLDKPGITYMPIQSDQFDYYIPNALSIMTKSSSELVATIAKLIKDPNYLTPTNRNSKMQIAEQYHHRHHWTISLRANFKYLGDNGHRTCDIY